jgi:hypothetical protein
VRRSPRGRPHDTRSHTTPEVTRHQKSHDTRSHTTPEVTRHRKMIPMAQYLISVFDDSTYTAPQPRRRKPRSMSSNEQLRSDGQWVFADGLAPPSTATVIDGCGGEAVLTDALHGDERVCRGVLDHREVHAPWIQRHFPRSGSEGSTTDGMPSSGVDSVMANGECPHHWYAAIANAPFG